MSFKILVSKDGTKKLLYDKKYICVLIPSKDEKWAVCVSCQIGCPIGCTFCHTGALERNLTAQEIYQQVLDAAQVIGKKPTSVVFMGMGEPMTNFVAVSEAIELIHKYGLAYKKITLSTSCVQLEKLLDVPYHVALSLHSPFDTVRKSLVGKTAMPVRKIVSFSQEYSKTRKFGAMIEYALIAGVNDRDEDAQELLSFIWPKNIFFNIIEYNAKDAFLPSQRLEYFKDEIRKKGYKCFIRQSRGFDIEASCGMLDFTS
jgi:23S rRNA (adenine2503-C2)-methyltransferase